MRPRRVRAPNSGYSQHDYFVWRRQRFRESWESVAPRPEIRGKRVLDVGAGFGGATAHLLSEGAQPVAGDIRPHRMATARAYCQDPTAAFCGFAAEALPCRDGVFDGVVLFDVLEHVADPLQTLSETRRMIKPGGWLFIEFTPFYSLAGHHLYDYTFLPVQYLPRWLAYPYIRRKAHRIGVDPAGPLHSLEHLNRISISRFHKFRRRLNLTLTWQAHTLRTFWFERNLGVFGRLAPLRELFTTAYTCLLKRGNDEH